jgi:hypothetical protein
MENTELYTQKLTRGKRSYFFDIKQTEQKDFFIKITESKPSNNGFEHHRVMVFEEDIEDFIVSFTQCLASYHKLKEAQLFETKPKTFSEIRGNHPNAYMPWTTNDDEKLEGLYCEGKTSKELAELFQRNVGAINSRIKKLGLREKYEK